MRVLSLAFAAALSLALAGGASAFEASDDATQAPSSAAPSAKAPAPAKPAPGAGGAAERTARSIECSQKADAQGLHGKPRKHFMRDCKHGR